jgi:L-malate glycosyltransferase
MFSLVTRLRLDGSVVFAGHYGAADGLAAFYEMASLYLSMSEHEGFCIPLLEAMHYGLPVLAYASTGVPFTLGEAGILLLQKEPAVAAEIAYEAVANDGLRERLLACQSARLRAFAPEKMHAQFRACLESRFQV